MFSITYQDENVTIVGKMSKDAQKFLKPFVSHMQDFTRPWTDAELYAKYGLTEEEKALIEAMIKSIACTRGQEPCALMSP